MKLKTIIAVLLVWLSVSALAQDRTLDVDSVDNRIYGVRLFPSEKPTESEIAYAADSRIFKVLKSNDTIVAVTDNKTIFEDPRRNLTRVQIKRTYVNGEIKFNDDSAPHMAFITHGRDTIFYIRELPMPNQPYELESGVIESFDLIKLNRSVSALVETLRLGQFVDSSINTIVLVYPTEDRHLRINDCLKVGDNYVEAGVVAFTRRKDEIQRIVVTSIDCLSKNSRVGIGCW